MFNPRRMFRQRRKKRRAPTTRVDADLTLKELALRQLVRSVDEYVQDPSTEYADVREMAEGLAWWPPEALEKVSFVFPAIVVF